MTLSPLAVAGAFALDVRSVADERGVFARTWDAQALAQAGLVDHFVQQSIAWNVRTGTLRGLHVALAPCAEAKIVRCVAGAAFDVIADVRPGSPTFGRHAAVQLDARNRRAVYVPPGCAHGYQTLADGTELQYDISETYRADCAGGVAYDDPELGIVWPLPVAVVSERDARLPSVREYLVSLRAMAPA